MSLLLVAADEAAILAAATASRAYAGVEAVEADFATIEDQDMKRYAYGWITILFFLVSIAGHWIFGWYAFLQEAAEHAQQPVFSEYAIEMAATLSRTGSRNSFSSCGK
jgi:hypothetical protein